MRRRGLLLLVAALVLGACGGDRGAPPPPPTAPPAGGTADPASELLDAAPALFRPRGDGATVQWVSRGPVEALVEWGLDPGALDRRREVSGEGAMEVVLDGLPPGRPAWYRCHFRRPGETAYGPGETHGFHTARPPGERFRVLLVADTHGYNTPREAVIRSNLEAAFARAGRDEPDFVLFLGDEAGVQAGGEGLMSQQGAFARWRTWRTLFTPLLRGTPAFLALGNHEGEAGFFQAHAADGGVEYLQRWGTIARKRYLCNPNPDTYPEGGENDGWSGEASSPATGGAEEGNRSPLQNYFAWSWGDALFVVLDGHRYTNVGGSTPGRVEDWTLGPAQLAWLERTLTESGARWKFVATHHLDGGWDYDLDGKSRETDYKYGRGGARYARVGEQARITDLMRRTGARFFLYGHDHVFAHQAAEGVEFICCGRPTFLQPLWWNTPGWREAYGEAASRRASDFLAAVGYTLLTIEPERVTVEYVRVVPSPDENVTPGSEGVVYRWDTSQPSPQVELVRPAR